MDSRVTSPVDTPGWQAHLELDFRVSGSRTIVGQKRHKGPLNIQRPFYPEQAACHVYLLHPPGGVVGGDRLEIDITVQKDAQVVVTTPGAAKFYRTEFDSAIVETRLNVSGDLEWFPLENIFYRSARVRQNTMVSLAENSRFIGWEVSCFGRPAAHEVFDEGDVSSCLRIQRSGRLMLLDRTRVMAPKFNQGSASLRGHPVAATLYATPFNTDQMNDLRCTFPQLESDDELLSFTLVDDILIARYLGHHTFRAHNQFKALWTEIRPRVMNRAACLPRIWNT